MCICMSTTSFTFSLLINNKVAYHCDQNDYYNNCNYSSNSSSNYSSYSATTTVTISVTISATITATNITTCVYVCNRVKRYLHISDICKRYVYVLLIIAN